MAKLRVRINDVEDDELLEDFIIIDDKLASPLTLAKKVADYIEKKFETEEGEPADLSDNEKEKE